VYPGACSTPGTRATGAACSDSKQCASGYCFDGQRCAEACRANAECGDGAFCHLPNGEETQGQLTICDAYATLCQPECAATEVCMEEAEPYCWTL
jgi:hypothetical protein